MPDPVAAFLREHAVMVLDGALATELERRGADLRDPLWSARVLLDAPALVRDVHLDYFRAGADVATTATYQATFEGCRRRGMDDAQTAQLMRSAVALAASARDEFWDGLENRVGRSKPLVAASIGPYGAMLADGSEYRGHYGIDDAVLREFHRPRLAVLASAGADLLAFETLPCLREALVLADLLTGFPTLSAWVAFACRDGEHDCEGERVADCAAALHRHPQIAALGVNCTPPQFVADLLTAMARRTDKPLLAYPNSGERYDAGTKCWAGTPPRALDSRPWYEAGARLIGGCCRTTPADIRALRREYART